MLNLNDPLHLGAAIAASAVTVTAGLIALRLLKAVRKPALPPGVPCCTHAPPAALAPLPGMLPRLRRALRLATAGPMRDAPPWVLLVGPLAAGKTSLAASALAFGGDQEPGLAPAPLLDGATCHRFHGGVLIDPDGADAANPARWLHLLDQIEQVRPARPLDALVLTVPAALLADQDAATMAAQAMRERLFTLHDRLEWVLPVYVVITACDRLAGGWAGAFGAATAGIAPTEILGWSAPEVGDYSGAARWSSSAFEQLSICFRRLQLRSARHATAIGSDEDDAGADAAFLFPHQLQSLRAPLAAWLETALRPGSPQQGMMMRGIYFTGAAAGDLPGPAQPRADVAGAADVVTAKVLAERALACPTRAGLWRRQLARRALLPAGAVLLVALATGLALQTAALRHDVQRMRTALPALAQVSSSSSSLEACPDRADVDTQLARIAAIPVPRFWPWSALDHRALEQGARAGAVALDRVVLPALACKLAQRTMELSTAGRPQRGAPGSAGAILTARDDLLAYLDQVVALERNYQRWAALGAAPATAGTALDGLLHDMYGIQAASGEVLAASLRHLPVRAALTPPRANLQRRIDQLRDRLPRYLSDYLNSGAEALAHLDRHAESLDAAKLAEGAGAARAWLEWIDTVLVPSTATRNPCQEIAVGLTQRQPALAAYGYRLQDQSMQGYLPSHCYRDLMADLTRQSLPGFGPLVTAERRLNPRLATELAGLASLAHLDFMGAAPAQPFHCVPQDAAWQAAAVGQAREAASHYREFAHKQGLRDGAARPLFDRLARRQLELVMNDMLGAAQYAPDDLPQDTGNDARLARHSARFAETVTSLTAVFEQYRQLDMQGSAANLAACTGAQATHALAQVDALAEQGRLYLPLAAAPIAPIAAAAEAAAVDLSGAAGLQDYLANQAARVQVLGNYAAPYVRMLQAVAKDGASAPKVMYWQRTLEAVNQYMARDSSGAVGKLHAFIVAELGGADGGPCAAAPPALEGDNGDLFSARRLTLARQLIARCGTEAQAHLLRDYGVLSDAFNAQLAGRYPFGPLSADDVAPLQLQQFLSQHGALLVAVRDRYRKQEPACASEQCLFIGQLDDARAALAPSLQSGAPLRLAVRFNPHPADAQGGEQLLQWTLSSGPDSIGAPNQQPGALDWAFGKPLAFALAWADRSSWRPLADPRQRDLQVDGTSAQFQFAGPWALLRMVERHRLSEEGDELLLQFMVPVAPLAKPAASRPTGQARVQLALRVGAADDPAKGPPPQRLPRAFPQYAPR